MGSNVPPKTPTRRRSEVRVKEKLHGPDHDGIADAGAGIEEGLPETRGVQLAPHPDEPVWVGDIGSRNDGLDGLATHVVGLSVVGYPHLLLDRLGTVDAKSGALWGTAGGGRGAGGGGGGFQGGGFPGRG